MNKKLILVGSGQVGKTSYVKELLGCQHTRNYTPTLGVEVHPVSFTLEDGTPTTFNIWDCAGTEKYGGLRDGYFINADYAIIMFSLDDNESFKNIRQWHDDINRVCENIPIVLVGNKSEGPCDIEDLPDKIPKNMPYFEISVRNRVNLFAPLRKFC